MTDDHGSGDGVLLRSFEPDLEVRAGGDGRTIVGTAVPYGKSQRIHDQLVEQFAKGAFRGQVAQAQRVPFARNHMVHGGVLIGRLDLMREDDHRLYIEARVSRTPAGDETLALVEDKALRELSIGFRPRQDRTLPDGTVERVKAELREVAIVLEGAYGTGATISAVRAGQAGACTCGGCACSSTARGASGAGPDQGRTRRELEALLAGFPERGSG